MSRDSARVFHHRTFLNETEGAAMVEATLTDNTWTNTQKERHVNFDGSIHLTDCSRSVEIDACFGDADGARSVLRKLARLEDAVSGLRAAVHRAAKREFGIK